MFVLHRYMSHAILMMYKIKNDISGSMSSVAHLISTIQHVCM